MARYADEKIKLRECILGQEKLRLETYFVSLAYYINEFRAHHETCSYILPLYTN
jgi:hypothetical protein